jgi:hypothetical protein
MKHAGDATLNAIEPVLIELRRLQGLREPRRGVFYRKSSAFIHFHEDPAGIFADVRGLSDWSRLPVNTAAEQRQFLAFAARALAGDGRATKKGGSPGGGRAGRTVARRGGRRSE